jgi:uncharacterized membrane protein HdeD (DUF308 family)
MLAILAKNWWVIAIRGVAAIIFGIITIVSPQAALLTIVYLFAAYAIVDGLSSILAAVRGEGITRGHGLWFFVLGAIGVIAGIGSIVYPNITALVLLYFVAAWAIVGGATQVYMSYQLRKEIQGEWLLALSGIAAIAFGVLLIVYPGAGLLSVLALVATFAIIYGVILLILAWKLRGMANNVNDLRRSATAS